MMSDRTVARVVAFGDAAAVELQDQPMRSPGRGRVRVRVTYASLGSTDVLARRGGYLLQPRPGFVPGYDFIGRLETTNDETARLGLSAGDRVAGILPRMGTHASHLTLSPSTLVVVPDGLPSAEAATLPLDTVTAEHAMRLLDLPKQATVLIQGVTGAVGTILAQKARRAGLRCYGTTSARTRHLAETQGVRVLDYSDRHWMDEAREMVGGFDGVIDHTGAPHLRQLGAREGRIVRLSFVGHPGREKRDTFVGTARTLLRSASRPSERLCSIPILVATQRDRYRTILTEQLALAAAGDITPPRAELVPLKKINDAHRLAERPEPGRKIVLQIGPDND